MTRLSAVNPQITLIIQVLRSNSPFTVKLRHEMSDEVLIDEVDSDSCGRIRTCLRMSFSLACEPKEAFIVFCCPVMGRPVRWIWEESMRMGRIGEG